MTRTQATGNREMGEGSGRASDRVAWALTVKTIHSEAARIAYSARLENLLRVSATASALSTGRPRLAAARAAIRTRDIHKYCFRSVAGLSALTRWTAASEADIPATNQMPMTVAS